MSRISGIPFVSRLVVAAAASLVAVSAFAGVPDVSGPAYVPVAQVSDIAPGTPPAISKKCKSNGKKSCRSRVRYSDADLRNLSDEDVAALGTVLAVIALAAVI